MGSACNQLKHKVLSPKCSPHRHIRRMVVIESLPLRHTVCSAEKSARISLEKPGNPRQFAIFQLETGPEKIARVIVGQLSPAFSPVAI